MLRLPHCQPIPGTPRVMSAAPLSTVALAAGLLLAGAPLEADTSTCANALDLSASTLPLSTDLNSGANANPTRVSCSHENASAGNDIWVKLPPLESGKCYSAATGSFPGGPNDTLVEIFAGTGCGDLNPVTCDDDGGPGFFTVARFAGDSTRQFYILAETYNNGGGAFHLDLAEDAAPLGTPSNDLCTSAIPIATLPYGEPTDNTLAGDEGTDNSASVGGTGGGGRDLFWSFTPSVAGTYTVAVSGTVDLAIAVFTGDCNSPVEIAARDMGPDGESLGFNAVAGTTYLILAEGFTGNHYGPFTLTLVGSTGPAAVASWEHYE